MKDLGSLGGTVAGNINGLNNRGEVIGASSLPGDPGCLTPNGCATDLFLWSKGKMIDHHEHGWRSSVPGVCDQYDAGEIVGAAAFPGKPFEAYIWRKGVVTDLGHLTDCLSVAFAINDHSQVVGGTIACPFSHRRAFLWEHGTMVDLNSLIPSGSALELVEARAINDRGEIAGTGVSRGAFPGDVDSLGRAFLLIPVCAGGTEGCADGPLDPAVVERSRAASGAAPKTMTAEELAKFKERIARMHCRDDPSESRLRILAKEIVPTW